MSALVASLSEHVRILGRHPLLLRPHSMYALCELLGLLVVRQLTLHPDGITVRRVRNSPVDGAITAALQSVVALTCPRCVPIKENLDARQAASKGLGLGDRLALGLRQELCRQGLLVNVGALLNGLHDGFVEFLQVGLREPLVLDRLELVACLTSGFSSNHELIERLEVGVCGAENEGVVARVDVGADQRCGLCVSAGDGEEVGSLRAVGQYLLSSILEGLRKTLTHDICLRADSNETVDVLADRDEHLARHVTTLLGTRSLILNVNPSCTLLDEQFCQLHHSRQASVTCISICNDGSQVVDVQAVGALCFGCGQAFLALLAVVEKLRHEQVGNLVRDSGL